MENKEKHLETKGKNKSKIIFFTALGVFVLAVVLIVWYFLSGYMSKDDYDKYTEPQTESTTQVQESSEDTTAELPTNPINFEELQNTNSDVYGWIRIPNTQVDYPVVQSTAEQGEDFYLDHNINKEYEFAGAIYSQMYNTKSFNDRNTVLYGHNMANNSMFGSLHSFRDETFFNENKYIYVYTPGHILTYEIFSAYRYDNRNIMTSFNFNDDAVYSEYLEFATNPKSLIVNVRSDVKVTTEDKIITLSTCINDHAYRYLVQGVLISDEETK